MENQGHESDNSNEEEEEEEEDTYKIRLTWDEIGQLKEKQDKDGF